MPPKKTPLCAAQAVEKALQERRQSDDNEDKNVNVGGSGRGRRRSQPATAIAGDMVARMAEQAEAQRNVLLSRLVGYGATIKPRNEASIRVVAPNKQEQQPQSTAKRVEAESEKRGRRDDRKAYDAPITIDKFDQKYAKDDPMLRFLIHVIKNGKSVVRAEIPRRPEGVDGVKRMSIPEEDVLFLAYHRTPPCGFRNVYWLEFIAETRAVDGEAEYFALSHHGLTHFRGSSVIDFVDIESWVLEKRAFDYMTAMRGLQKLQGLLFFMSWKKKAIRLKHHRVRARIASSLFQCDNAAAQLLVRIRSLCVKIEECGDDHYLTPSTSFKIDQIDQCYRRRIKAVRAKVNGEASQICVIIHEEIAGLTTQRQVEVEGEKQNYANVSRSSRLLDRLYVFLRLVDFHLFESITTHLNQFVENIHAQVCGRAEASGRHKLTEAAVEAGSMQSVTLSPAGTSAGGARLVDYCFLFSLRLRVAPTPFVYGLLLEDVEPAQPATAVNMEVSPSQSEVFDLVYSLLNSYVSCMDSIPKVLSDKRFYSVMAPYTPQNRQSFLASLLRPSTQILQNQTKKLKEMKYAIDTYYKQLEIQVSDRLRLVGDVYTADESERHQKDSNELIDGLSTTVLTADQYEAARFEWTALLTEIRATPRIFQIGIILLDQSELLVKLEDFVQKHMREMMDELPHVYKQFLCDLLVDVDGRIDRVTRIPTSIPGAQEWLKEVMEMMPSHNFRKAFDIKCANLSRLKQLLKDSGVSWQNSEEQEFVKKKDYEWESIFETLIICLARVQERDSEHRRSVMEISTKADEHITARVDEVKIDFTKLPPHEEEILLDKRRAKELAKKKQDMIAQLEQLVSLDGEREEMLEMFTTFEIEHRMVIDPNGFESQDATRPPARWDVKTPCERLLQHVSIVVDMRAWFASWVQLEEKWLDTPLIMLHGSLVLSRVKQFRRRLQFASTRLLPVSSPDPDDEFRIRDHRLVKDLEGRVDQIASDCVILHAATCGVFSSDRWATCRRALGLENVEFNSVTLRMIKVRAQIEPAAVNEFKGLCEVVLIEANLQSIAERVRVRYSTCRVLVKSSNSRVVFVNMQELVLELDDMLMEARRIVQAHNPGLDVAINLLRDIQDSLQVCDRLLSFQAVWDEQCQLIRVHDIDEFFTGQVAWKGPIQRQRKKAGRDESTWADYVEVAQTWSDRLRRLVCMSQSEASVTTPVQATSKRQGDSITQPCDVWCAIHDVIAAFDGFDFDASTAKCELANQLVEKYMGTLRDKCPRLYQLSKQQLIQLLINDDDLATMQTALSHCYPGVTAFVITKGRKQEGQLLQDNGLVFSKNDTSESGGSVVIKGARCGGLEREFNVPVVKVGRLRFWLTRLDEEMASVVLDNTKQAVTQCLALGQSSREAFGEWYEELYPQSISAALSHDFTSAMRSAINWIDALDDREDAVDDDSIGSASTRVQIERERFLVDVVARVCGIGGHRNDPRLDSMVLLLKYQTEVAGSVHNSIANSRPEEAKLIWDSQFKVDFLVEDTSTKHAQRVRQCDHETWTEIGALGPSYPLTFLGSICQSDFSIGKELVGAHRIPVITPLTQRCVFEIFQALRGRPLSLVSPMNKSGRGGHVTTIQGIAQMLMKPLFEASCTACIPADLLKISNQLKAMIALGSLLSINNLELCDGNTARVLAEKMKQLRQDVHGGVVAIGSSPSEHRSSALPSPTACVFAPIKSRMAESSGLRQLLLYSSDLFHPVSIVLPAIAHFTRTMALLAGYKIDEIARLHRVVVFFESLASWLTGNDECAATAVYLLIRKVMEDVSRVRYTSRVLLPSTGKLPAQVPRGTRRGGRRISTLFRRSADAQDLSDVAVHTLFRHVLLTWHSTLLAKICRSGHDDGLEAVKTLLDQNFPSAKGCELVDKTTRSTDEALWDAVEMSLGHAGLITSHTMVEKAVELSNILQSYSAIIVTGCCGVGKSTCIKALHNALQALEMADSADAKDAADANTRTAPVAEETSRLLFVSPRFFIRHQDIQDRRNQRILQSAVLQSAVASSALRSWLCVDGVLDSGDVETFVSKRGGDYCEGIRSERPRTIFETSHLASLSPAILVAIRVLHIPQTLTQKDLLASWRANSTNKLPFPEDSRGATNVALIFRLTEHFLNGAVSQFISAEESSHVTSSTASVVPSISSSTPAAPTHFGYLSVQHLTLSSFHLIGSACFRHRYLLEERSAVQVAHLVIFCIIWGFAGHLSELYRQKLDQLLRQETKQFSELKQVADTQGDLYDSELLGPTFWESIHLPLRGLQPTDLQVKDQSKSHAKRLVHDPKACGNQILVLSQAATPLVRVLRLLIQSNQSFLIAGPRGSGKTAILRMLWYMNLEDQAAEVMVDASLDHRFAPDILNWQYKPLKWFEPPETSQSDTTQHRGRAGDEALLFTSLSAPAAKFVFVEDLALRNDSSSEWAVGAVEEFVRQVLDHKLAINWTAQAIQPITKAFGATMTRRELAIPRQCATSRVEPLLRHFSVFNMTSYDRQQLQSIFRHVYIQYFGTISSQSHSSDRHLSLPEIVIRASVDLATDALTVQHTSDRLEIVEGFSFNLHRLNAELSRTLSFCQMASSSQHGAQGTDSGANLLSLGKLHQCWISVLRQEFLLACLRRAPPPTIPTDDPSLAVVAIDDVKKIMLSMKMTSEKYFSVPVRDEPYKALVTDIIYGTYRYLTSKPQLADSYKTSLEELLTSNASASSSSGARRKQSTLNGDANPSENVGMVMARDEFAVSAAREMVLSLVEQHFCNPSATCSFNEATRLTVRLHLSSSVGLHQLLHALQAIVQSENIFVDEELLPIHERVVALAFTMECFEIVYMSEPSASRAQINNVLVAAATGAKRIALWIRLDELEGQPHFQDVVDLLTATSLGKIPARVFDHHPLLEEIIKSCVQNQQELRILTDEDVFAHFRSQLRQYLRLVIVGGTSQEDSSPSWLQELIRGSGAFQWVSLAAEADPLRYQEEVTQRAMREIGGLLVGNLVSRHTIDEDIADDRHKPLSGLVQNTWNENFATRRWSEDTCLSFTANVVAEFKRLKEEVAQRLGEREQLAQALNGIKMRTPQLQERSRFLTNRLEQLSVWHDELLEPLEELKNQFRERAKDLHDREAGLASDELRVLQRRLQKLELQIWSHRAMISEYDMGRHEVRCQKHEIEEEISHWRKYESLRKSTEHRFAHQLVLLRSAQDPRWLMERSLQSVSLLFSRRGAVCGVGGDGVPTDVNGEANHPADETENETRRLWRARFPFLEGACGSDRVDGDALLWSVDGIYDRVPLIVDKCGLFQHVLVQLFSNLPLFADANDEHERRESVGFTSTGAVAPMIVQCDDSDKMWQKIREAEQKQTPVLLVGVPEHQIRSLATFFARKQTPEHRATSRILAELTHEATRHQLKRNEAQVHKDGSSRANGAVISVLTSSAASPCMSDAKKRNKLPNLLSKETGASPAQGSTRRGSVADAGAFVSTRRASFILAESARQSAVAPPRGAGFRMYVVTHHSIDADVVRQSGGFLLREVSWATANIETFFLESWIRRFDKRLYKDLVDSRQAEVFSAYCVKQAEEAVWPTVETQSWMQVEGREAFMHQLTRLKEEDERLRMQTSKLQVRAIALVVRREQFSATARQLALVMRSATLFAATVMPQCSLHVRSYRFYEQILDVAASTLLEHTQNSATNGQATAAIEPSAIATHLLQAVMPTPASPSHQLVLLMLVTINSIALGETFVVVRKEALDIFQWLLHCGLPTWSRSSEKGKKKKALSQDASHFTSDATTDASSSVSAADGARTVTPAATGSSSASLVERLRRKVRVCALIFDTIGGSGDKDAQWTRREHEDTITPLFSAMPCRAGEDARDLDLTGERKPELKGQSTEPGDVERMFRSIARTIKSLWVEWSLAKETQRQDLRLAIASIAPTLLVNRVGATVGSKRRHHSVKDMTLASSTVTEVLSLRYVVAQHLGCDYSSVDEPSHGFGERLAAVMITKVYFPQQLKQEWIACISSQSDLVKDVLTCGSPRATTQLLCIDPTTQPEVSGDAQNDAVVLEQPLQLPPSIDVAWRRDDLVHLPSRVFVYEATRERDTIEVVFLRLKTASASSGGSRMRVLSVLALEEYETRLREQVIASVTSKERFTIEISSENHLDSVLALVSQVINQHALLCIPEWYVVCDLELFARIQSPSMGFLHVHVVTKAAEPISLERQLSQWLIKNASLCDEDAAIASRGLLMQASRESQEQERESDSTVCRPLATAAEALVAQCKAIQQTGDLASWQLRLKRLVQAQFDVVTRAKKSDPMVDKTLESVDVLSDLLLLSLPKQERTQREATASDPASALEGMILKNQQQGLPQPLVALILQLEKLCEMMPPPTVHDATVDVNAGTARWSSSLLIASSASAVPLALAFIRLLKGATLADTNLLSRQRSALVKNGVVPVEWLAQTLPTLNDVCLANLVSVAQLLVFVLSRIGFSLHAQSGEPLAVLPLSLVDDPRRLLMAVQQAYVSTMHIDAADTEFVLEAAPAPKEDADTKTPESDAVVSPEKRMRKQSLGPRRRSTATGTQKDADRAAAAHAGPSWLVASDDRQVPCGIRVEGLVAVERISSTKTGKTQIFLHELPPCRLVCRPRQADLTLRISTVPLASAVSSPRLALNDSPIATALKQEGVPLTTIASTSPFQTFPDSFWGAPTASSPAILDRVVLALSLLVAVPSLSRSSNEQDSVTVVLAVPMFSSDDDDVD